MKRVELKRKKPWRPKVKPRVSRTPPADMAFSGLDAELKAMVAIATKPRATLKPSKPKMTRARKEAQGKPCLIRLPGCYPGPENETVVGCHYRLANTCGEGLKPDDTLMAFGCHHCHGVVDGRLPLPAGYTVGEVRLAFAEGVMRTMLYMKGLHARE